MVRLLVALVASAAALAPKAPQTHAPKLSRGEVLKTVFGSAAAAAAAGALPSFAVDDMSAVPEPEPYKFPTDWGITSDYYTDAQKVVAHMRLATSLDKGAPDMEKIALNTKKEMIDFVAFYRRFTNVSGKQSFSTLYTAINVLAGHYTSYGPKFPVPEKRRKRLYQEYAEIEKNIKKRR
ncbi:photosystem II Pbs27 [Aureococcus anophagefferens]|jgi:photosystem II Psb27 protein|nr:photosystem II Pbs27 [Aureococcus anophagefferens]|mmetsp:Transcript_24087/g.82770  ORF Transcript_24087/g.82770 Transcript_24087/m.82770 type:complete len:179 (+) Transcript_24087:73-609(+)